MSLSDTQSWMVGRLVRAGDEGIRCRDGNEERTARSLVRKGYARWEPPGTNARLVGTRLARGYER